VGERGRRLGAYISDHRHRRLLRGCGERPRGGGAAGGKSVHFIDLHHEVILPPDRYATL
jgi:hypothetical protein